MPRGMLADIRGEDFQDLWVVVLGVSRDALKGIDATEADIEFVVAQLLDRLGEAIRELPSPIQAERSSGVDGTDDRDCPRQQRQSRCTHALSCVGPPCC